MGKSFYTRENKTLEKQMVFPGLLSGWTRVDVSAMTHDLACVTRFSNVSIHADVSLSQYYGVTATT